MGVILVSKLDAYYKEREREAQESLDRARRDTDKEAIAYWDGRLTEVQATREKIKDGLD